MMKWEGKTQLKGEEKLKENGKRRERKIKGEGEERSKGREGGSEKRNTAGRS